MIAPRDHLERIFPLTTNSIGLIAQMILQMMLGAYQSHSIPYPFFRRTSGAM
jgi:hypothetical protein